MDNGSLLFNARPAIFEHEVSPINTKTNNADLARYEKLMKDWKNSSLAGVKKKEGVEKNPTESLRIEIQDSTPIPAVDPHPPSGNPASVDRTWQSGMILSINDHTLGVYKKFMPESDIHVVAILCPNGFIKTQGVSLEALEVDEIGNLTPELFKQFESRSKWKRDLIVFHCYRYEDTFRIPTPGLSGTTGHQRPQPHELDRPAAGSDPGTAQPVGHEPVVPEENVDLEPQDPIASMQRGQRIQIQMGIKLWNAVFWGCDTSGMVVAHQTCEKWSLMHFDLNRYRDSLKIDPQADKDLVREIQEGLS